MSLKVIDKTGRLPKNPKDWPAELRRAIAECCCGDSSSSDTSSSGDRPSLDTGICGCPVDVLSGWTQPLIATVTSSLFGTFTVPLFSSGAFVPPGISVEYNGVASFGSSVFSVMFNCPPGPNNCGFFQSVERAARVKLQCAICPSSPSGKLWLADVRVGGLLGNSRSCSGSAPLPESSEHGVGYIAQLLACDPVVFQEQALTTSCPESSPVDCCGAGNIQIIQCFALVREKTDGHTITVNISE